MMSLPRKKWIKSFDQEVKQFEKTGRIYPESRKRIKIFKQMIKMRAKYKLGDQPLKPYKK